MASLPCRLCGLLGGLSRSITCRTASSAYMPANAEALRPSIARLSAATVTGFALDLDFALDFTLRLAFAIFPPIVDGSWPSPHDATPEPDGEPGLRASANRNLGACIASTGLLLGGSPSRLREVLHACGAFEKRHEAPREVGRC